MSALLSALEMITRPWGTAKTVCGGVHMQPNVLRQGYLILIYLIMPDMRLLYLFHECSVSVALENRLSTLARPVSFQVRLPTRSVVCWYKLPISPSYVSISLRY
jgi:hypothetical protein